MTSSKPIEGRLYFYYAAIRMITENPILGVGYNNFGLEFWDGRARDCYGRQAWMSGFASMSPTIWRALFIGRSPGNRQPCRPCVKSCPGGYLSGRQPMPSVLPGTWQLPCAVCGAGIVLTIPPDNLAIAVSDPMCVRSGLLAFSPLMFLDNVFTSSKGDMISKLPGSHRHRRT